MSARRAVVTVAMFAALSKALAHHVMTVMMAVMIGVIEHLL